MKSATSTSALPATRRYRFDDLTLDVGQRRLWRGEEPIGLSRLSFDLLRVLVEAAPNLVTHDELAAKAWGPRRIVTAENLAKRVMLLRQALGDHAEQARYVEGLRGQGYRLVPVVEHPDAQAGPATQAVGAAGSSKDASPARVPARRATASLGYWLAGSLAVALALVAVHDYRVRSALRDASVESSAVLNERSQFRFALDAPAGSEFGITMGYPNPALSPSGEMLAFVARYEGADRLWVQRLGALDAEALAGTEGAGSPFWSPDGRFIAFSAGGRLMRIATTGRGAPNDVIRFDGAYGGGTWAPDGTIVFSAQGRLYRVAAERGEVALLTSPDESRGEFSYRFPIMLPDGRRFVYLALSTQAEHQGWYVGSLDDPSVKTWLRSGNTNAALDHGPDGRLYLLFLGDEGMLLAQPFDASHGRLVGDPVVVSSHSIEPGPSVRYAAFAASGRVLVYRPRFAPATRLSWIDRRKMRVEILHEARHSYRFPALSPDGTSLIVSSDQPDPAGLWRLHLQGGEGVRLIDGSAWQSAWVPGGTHIVYTLVLPGAFQILRRSINPGGVASTVFAEPEPYQKRVRDVTGDTVLFQTGGVDGQLWTASLSGERRAERLSLMDGLKDHARFSRDGRWLVFTSRDAGYTRIYVTAFPVTSNPTVTPLFAGSDPQWRADGQELYYIEPNQTTLTAVAVKAQEPFKFGIPERLFDAAFDTRSLTFGSVYAPTSDGQRFLVVEAVERDQPRLVVTRNWAASSD